MMVFLLPGLLQNILHSNGSTQPKTLFATHYHELNELANKFPRVKNFNVATKEVGQKVVFLRKLVEGGSHHSFGIHVAKMAGMPRSIIERAANILVQLEQKSIDQDAEKGMVNAKKPETSQISTDAYQLSIFETVDETAGKIKEALLDLDINTLTPIECMMKLNELKKVVEGE